MGVITYDMDVPSKIAPEKLFKAFVLESDTLIPKIAPEAIKSVEILEGDGGPGTVKLVHFGDASPLKSAKHKIDAIDKVNLTYSYSINEGEALMGTLDSITYHVQIVPSGDGGSICRNRSIYNCKEGAKVSEEEIKAGKEKATGLFKAVEAYLLAHPDEC